MCLEVLCDDVVCLREEPKPRAEFGTRIVKGAVGDDARIEDVRYRWCGDGDCGDSDRLSCLLDGLVQVVV
jgi:hypothetical protein